MEHIQNLKKDIRRRILDLRDAMDPAERARASCALADRIIGHQWFYRAEALLCFASFGSEIDTGEIMAEAWRKKKSVYVPKVEGRELEFYRISSMEELSGGYRGIPEPDGEGERYVFDPAKRVLMLMPGVAFDAVGRRLGYGGGFYDRYLSDKEALRLCAVGIGFACQRVEELPEEESDVRPYQVILQ